MTENRDNWPSGHRKPRTSGHRMPAENILFPRPCYEGMISTSLEVIWEISAHGSDGPARHVCRIREPGCSCSRLLRARGLAGSRPGGTLWGVHGLHRSEVQRLVDPRGPRVQASHGKGSVHRPLTGGDGAPLPRARRARRARERPRAHEERESRRSVRPARLLPDRGRRRVDRARCRRRRGLASALCGAGSSGPGRRCALRYRRRLAWSTRRPWTRS